MMMIRVGQTGLRCSDPGVEVCVCEFLLMHKAEKRSKTWGLV